jgi:homoserine kinase type II
MHRVLADFAPTRANTLGPDGWSALLTRCGSDLDRIEPGLAARLDAARAAVLADWPDALPRSAIHADLFPDNVLMRGDTVTGLIDFYFACTDVRAYDLAVMHSAWAFDAAGAPAQPAVGRALVDGYEAVLPLAADERRALSVLAQGACLRFAATRAWDWLNTPADALVTRKDPLAYVRRLDFYRDRGEGAFA